MNTYEKFQNPSEAFTTVPFWFWNDKMEKEEIKRQLKLMREQHIYQCCIHARYGLKTPYFSEEWFECVDYALKEGKKLGMRFWLYDENNFPSGYADGRVIAENPDFCGKHLKMFCVKAGENILLPEVVDILAVFKKDSQGWVQTDTEDLSAERRVFAVCYTRWKVAYGDDYYIDVLNPCVARVFLNVTHHEYLKRFGEEFGKTICGFFSDEAGFYNGLQLPWSDRNDDGTLVWTDRLPEYFKNRNGYDIIRVLPYLFEFNSAFSPKARVDFQETVSSLYRESFLRPQRLFCEEHGMKFIGHLHYEDYLHLQIATQGNFANAIAEFSYAGLDRIEYTPGAISERTVSSIARQYKKERTLSETFAQGGWDFTMADMRRWTDFQLVRGINLFVIHAFFYSIDDFRKDDAPPSYFFQNPMFPFYHIYSDYTMRLCELLTSGKNKTDGIAVYYPIVSAQAEFDPFDWERVRSLDRDVQEVVRALEEAQYDCCLITDEGFQHFEFAERTFNVGQDEFSALAVTAKYMPLETLKKIELLAKEGIPIAILLYKPMCAESDSQNDFSEVLERVLRFPQVEFIDEYHFYRKYTYRFDVGCFKEISGFRQSVKPLITLQKPDENIKCCVKIIDGLAVYFIVNEGSDVGNNVIFFDEKTAPVLWDAVDGGKTAISYTEVDGKISVPLSIPSYSSVVVVFGDTLPGFTPKKHLIARVPLDNDWLISFENKRYECEIKRFSAEKCTAQSITYEYNLFLEKVGDTAILTFSELHNICAVEINGCAAGVILWKPFALETTLFREGQNCIKLTVYTTAAAKFGQKSLPYGIAGPVFVDIYTKEEK